MAATDRNSSGRSGQYPCVGTSGASDLPDVAMIVASVDEPQLFGRVFDRHAPIVHRYLTSRVGTDAADDLVSEVFLTAFRSRAGYDPRYVDALPWLLGIAANFVRHHRRSEGRRWALFKRLTLEPLDQNNQRLDEIGRNLIVRSESEQMALALARLDERYRSVLILHAAFDLTYDEVAKTLELRVGTVRSRISRGRTKLRELLDASGQYLSDGENHRSLEVEGTSQ